MTDRRWLSSQSTARAPAAAIAAVIDGDFSTRLVDKGPKQMYARSPVRHMAPAATVSSGPDQAAAVDDAPAHLRGDVADAGQVADFRCMSQHRQLLGPTSPDRTAG